MPADITESGALADISKSGSAVKSRAGDATQAWEIAKSLIKDNSTRDERMTRVQGNIDGNAPISQAKMKADGKAGTANVNWREGKGQLSNAWTPYYDLTCEVPVCIDGEIDTGDPTMDAELMRGFAEAFHKMVFNWDGFDLMTQLRDWQMLTHGTGWLVRTDPNDWRWETVLATNFYVPSKMLLDMTSGSYVMFTTEMEVGELWRKIGKPGWNEKAIMQAIRSSGMGDSEGWNDAQWQQAFKNGDAHVSSRSKVVRICNLLVKEMDGKISVQMVRRDGPEKPTDFLYKKIGGFEDWNECVCLFPYDIGSDGTIHSVKGLGTEVHAYCDLSNRINNSFANLMLSGILPTFQAETADAGQKWQMAKIGDMNVVPKGLTKLDMNIGTAIAPALTVKQHFESTLTKNTGSFHEDVATPTVEETAAAARIRMAGRSKLTKGAHNRFYRGMDRMYLEMWRVAVSPKIRAEMPGGKEALKFQKKCKLIIERLGAPKDALQMVENIHATRSLGLGSPAMRLEIATAFMDPNFFDRLDPVGQNNVLRAYAAVNTGYHNIDAIVPSLASGEVAVEDDSQAADENNAFNMLGMEAEAVITPRQQHEIHLKHHVASMERDMEACQAGQKEPRECFERLEAKGAHSHQHLDMLSKNIGKKQAVAEYGERLRQLAAYQDQLQQNIEEEDAANPVEEPGNPSPEMVKVQGNLELKSQKQQGDAALKVQKQQLDSALKVQKARVDNALNDAKTAAQIRNDVVKARSKPKPTPAKK